GVDWHGFLLPTTRTGEINCSGGALYDPARARYVTLAYGTTWRRGVFTCTSRRAGVTCRTAKGHGIFVSRGSWLTWYRQDRAAARRSPAHGRAVAPRGDERRDPRPAGAPGRAALDCAHGLAATRAARAGAARRAEEELVRPLARQVAFGR